MFNELRALSSDSLVVKNIVDIDYATIKVCKRLRQLAKLNRIKLDLTEHRSGLNKHLFDYIEYCGVDVLEYIKQYLSNLQPYMIERRKDQEVKKSYICIIDKLYKISVYIKVDSTQFEEIIVSFHEDNKRGVAKTNSLIKEQSKYVPVFADSILSKSGENYVTKVIVQRGLKVLPIEVAATKIEDYFVVSRKSIDEQFISYCNDYIRDLYTSDLDLNFDSIEIFSMLQQISFTSYGNDTFSSISLLIDSLVLQNDRISKSVADIALVTFLQNLTLTSEQRNELLYLLNEKYKVTCIKSIDVILSRISDNLLNVE